MKGIKSVKGINGKGMKGINEIITLRLLYRVVFFVTVLVWLHYVYLLHIYIYDCVCIYLCH